MKRNLQEFIGITLVIILMFIAVGMFQGKEENMDTPASYLNGDNIDTAEMTKFKIFSRDINTDKDIVVGEFEFSNKQDTIEKRLEFIAGLLSEKEFKNLPIEFVKIEEVDGKKVAVFNLKESEENLDKDMWTEYTGASWAKDYFQGSAGGGWTCYTLQETMLQPGYDGEWIDGVRFLYNGEENKDFQHVEGIERIKYR